MVGLHEVRLGHGELLHHIICIGGQLRVSEKQDKIGGNGHLPTACKSKENC